MKMLEQSFDYVIQVLPGITGAVETDVACSFVEGAYRAGGTGDGHEHVRAYRASSGAV
jgi:hypothetical protein